MRRGANRTYLSQEAFFERHGAAKEEVDRVAKYLTDRELRVVEQSVAFKRKNRHWRLVNDPFPATLHPGSCLALVIQYRATERFPRACELLITSDDPTYPVRAIELLAATIWGDCGGEKGCGCEKCRPSGNCDPRRCDPCGHEDGDEDGDGE